MVAPFPCKGGVVNKGVEYNGFLNGQVCLNSSNQRTTGWFRTQGGGRPSEDIMVAALFVIMPTHFLYVEKCDMKQMKFKTNPMGWQPLKNPVKQ